LPTSEAIYNVAEAPVAGNAKELAASTTEGLAVAKLTMPEIATLLVVVPAASLTGTKLLPEAATVGKSDIVTLGIINSL
jgi:hypothetical protein